jgi:stage II sporulation protein D
VIKWEISPSWPLEAVKAQAIVARSFAYANIGRHGEEGYDLCRSQHCQVYGGVESEDPRATMAVNLTRGKVITLGGKLINSIYHATCGGGTADASLVWGGKDLWYLRGVRCRFCRYSPHHYWSCRISIEEIEGALRKKGLDVGKVRAIYPVKRDRFGRIQKLVIIHSKGRDVMGANAFRLAIGPEKVRSTLFTLQRSSDYFFFNGRGWGHGVGMCQWGAKGMAEDGFDYLDIIHHYYPDTEISIK